MELIKEKKIVFDFFGWEYGEHLYVDIHREQQPAFTKSDGTFGRISFWNPHRDLNCWEEMFDLLDDVQYERYQDILFKDHCPAGLDINTFFHRAPPENRWESFLKMIKEQ